MDNALSDAGGNNHEYKEFPNVGHGILHVQDERGKFYVEEHIIQWCDQSIEKQRRLT